MGQKKILLCDDEPHLRELIASRLCRDGFAILEATDGIECMQVVHRGQPDVIVLDLNMPRAGGIDVLNSLADEALSIPVIILTGSLTKRDESTIRNLGHARIVAKPFAIDQLVSRIKKVCN